MPPTQISCGNVPVDKTAAATPVEPVCACEELEEPIPAVFEPEPPFAITPPPPVDGAETGEDAEVFPCDGAEVGGMYDATLPELVASKEMFVIQVGCPGKEARSVKLIGTPCPTGVSSVSTWMRVPLGLPAHRVMKSRGMAVFPTCAKTAK